jgi:hypothetical protein
VFGPRAGGSIRFRSAVAPTPQRIDASGALGWGLGRFSLDASARTGGHDRPGLERLVHP